ncbi:MAG: hypothetical protein JWM80_2104 [Cyanobacteria bacterium RYN_339]|nr:hypothetical protein [Cyanobacteria bacterium RYN_339]
MVMKQVDLQRGASVQTAWIEARGARLGATIELKLGEGERSPGWQVTRVYQQGLPEEQVLINATAHKHHRAYTDI